MAQVLITLTLQKCPLYLNINDGSKLAEVLIKLGDVVEFSRDLAHLQLGVHIVIPLWETALVLVIKAWPEIKRRQ